MCINMNWANCFVTFLIFVLWYVFYSTALFQLQICDFESEGEKKKFILFTELCISFKDFLISPPFFFFKESAIYCLYFLVAGCSFLVHMQRLGGLCVSEQCVPPVPEATCSSTSSSAHLHCLLYRSMFWLPRWFMKKESRSIYLNLKKSLKLFNVLKFGKYHLTVDDIICFLNKVVL